MAAAMDISAGLAGRVALVTGASRGIGAATATRLAAHGALVGVGGRDEAAIDRVVDRIRADGGRAAPAPADANAASDCSKEGDCPGPGPTQSLKEPRELWGYLLKWRGRAADGQPRRAARAGGGGVAQPPKPDRRPRAAAGNPPTPPGAGVG